LLFVSEPTEAAARARFKSVLPPRLFAVERGFAEAPAAVVARVLEEGPVPMGPVVYTGAAGDVGTVICRCMPAQAQRLSGQRAYDLVEIDEIQEAELLSRRIEMFRPPNAISFEHWFWPDRLNQRLRSF
jgi:hypothetical protein